MGKYNHLAGIIPEQQTVRTAALQAALDERREKSIAELALEYNALVAEEEKLQPQVDSIKLRYLALEILIRRGIERDMLDGAKADGYTWSPGYEPIPVCKDPAAAAEYFRTHDMADQLSLSAAEINGRVKNFVKQEALQNELRIETTPEVDPLTGESHDVTTVHSAIPGVEVYLKPKLGRTKSSTK